METTPMAGKFWQSTHELPCGREEKGRDGGMLISKPNHHNTNSLNN